LIKAHLFRGLVLSPLFVYGCTAGSPALTVPDSGEAVEAPGSIPPQSAPLPDATRPDPTLTPEPAVTLRGWLSIVWNDQPHFFITDDSGQTVEVLLNEHLTAPFGGPLALDRTRVVVRAVVTEESPTLFQALSIEREAGG
jgi:hypothetical protein